MSRGPGPLGLISVNSPERPRPGGGSILDREGRLQPASSPPADGNSSRLPQKETGFLYSTILRETCPRREGHDEDKCICYRRECSGRSRCLARRHVVDR